MKKIAYIILTAFLPLTGECVSTITKDVGTATGNLTQSYVVPGSGVQITIGANTGIQFPYTSGIFKFNASGYPVVAVAGTDYVLPAGPFSWSGVTGTPTTLSGYGITDAYTKTQSDARYAAIAGPFPWADVTGTPTSLSGYGITDGVSTSGSYTNPSWIVSLPWSKITSTPTTLSGYGITDAVSSTATHSANTVFAGPTSGAAASASFRSLVDADLSGTTFVSTSGSYTNPSWIASLAYSKLTGAPSSLPPSGTASGDLSGFYPSPTVAKINGTALSGLATGILKNTTSTGVPSIAVASDFPILNQNTTGNAGTVTGLSVVTGKTLTASNSITITGTDGSTINVGSGGTLGSAAFTSASAYEVPLTFSTGLTRTVNTVTVNTSQNITTLSNLTANGFVKTSGGVGSLSVDTSTYITGNQNITLTGDASGSGTTSIPVVVTKSNGTAFGSAAFSASSAFAPATTGTSILYANGSGGFNPVTIGANLSFSAGTLSASGSSGGGSGTVTSVSISAESTYIGVSGSPITSSGTISLSLSSSVTTQGNILNDANGLAKYDSQGSFISPSFSSSRPTSDSSHWKMYSVSNGGAIWGVTNTDTSGNTYELELNTDGGIYTRYNGLHGGVLYLNASSSSDGGKIFGNASGTNAGGTMDFSGGTTYPGGSINLKDGNGTITLGTGAILSLPASSGKVMYTSTSAPTSGIAKFSGSGLASVASASDFPSLPYLPTSGGTVGGNINVTGSLSASQVSTGVIITPTNGSSPSAQLGTLYVSNFATNNLFLGENVYYDGTNLRYGNNGTAELIYYLGQDVAFMSCPSGTAAGVATSAVNFKVSPNGSFGFGSSISTSQGIYTGANISGDSSGNLSGIGTVTFSNTLLGTYSGASSGVAKFGNNGTGNALIDSGGSSNATIINYYSQGNVQVCQNGGNVLIGTTTDDGANKLQVAGGIKATGKIISPASTTASASLNIPHGAAPTSPANGDLWTTTSGLYVQVNGATVGPLSTGTVAGVASGNLSPLFTSSVSGSTGSASISYSLTSAAAYSWFGNATGSSASPSYNTGALPVSVIPVATTSALGGVKPDGTSISITSAGVISAVGGTSVQVPVRQTVLSGPVDTSGLPAFLPATAGSLSISSQSVGTSTPLVVTAANGFGSSGAVNRVGQSTSNLTWSSLASSNTNYLYIDIDGSGNLTTGSTTAAPVYQFGGTRSTTSGQFTFNYGPGEMSATVGNGSTAVQTYRVYVGEAVTNSSTVTSTVAYAYQGRYESGFTSTLPGTATSISKNHNIGCPQIVPLFSIKCLTAEQGYSVGDILVDWLTQNNVSYMTQTKWFTAKTIGYTTGSNSNAWDVINKSSGQLNGLTAADWAYAISAQRAW